MKKVGKALVLPLPTFFPSQKTQTRTMQSSRWIFTLNNYNDHQVAHIVSVLGDRSVVRYGTFGREVAPTTGTPHLQGYIIFTGNKRLSSLLRIFGPGPHWEIARGSSQQNKVYCQKGGDYEEFGSFPADQGRRSDLEKVIEWIDEFTTTNGRPPSSIDFAKEQPCAYVKYPRLVKLAEQRAERVALESDDPHDWQLRLEEELKEEADDRTIRFYVDPTGGNGKTWFCRYYLSKYNDGQVLGVGKRDDLSHAIDNSKRVFFINVPRGAMEFLQYTILEQLKDRMVFSPKYDSQLKVFRHKVHVIVFTNEHPDMNKMSDDRYEIINF